MQWSLNTYQTCQEWELGRILDTAEATGYHGVELLMDYKQKHGFEWDTPREAWDGLKAPSRWERCCYLFTHKLPKFPLRKRR